ncbi:MAG: hypothetical protein WKF48_12375 [Solirubrobacteraceae bacterium]
MQRSVLYPLVYSAPVGGSGHGTIRLRGATFGGGAASAPAAAAPIAAADASTVGHGTIRMGNHVKGVSFAPVRLPDASPPVREGVAGTSKSLHPRINIR